MSPTPSAFEPNPRTIWTFWEQGYDRAPPIVQACLESWRRVNPSWRLVALDGQSIHQLVDLREFADPRRTDITIQKIAAIARLCLLRKYGGVWTDPTVYCLKPLDEWLPKYSAYGFFAFRNPAPDRLASNWFLAAESDDPILRALHSEFTRMWARIRFANQHTALGNWTLEHLSPILNARADRAVLWTNPVLQRLLRIYPSFIFNYTFNKIVLRRPELRCQWRSAASLEARPMHRVRELARSKTGLTTLNRELTRADWPMQKLDWHFDSSEGYWNAALGLLEQYTTPQVARFA